MIAPKYRVLVDWGGATSVIRVGSGHVGGPEVITAGSASDLFDGVYDSPYSDVTTDVLEGKIQRKLGSDGIVESTIDLTLTDVWPGKYNAKNPGVLGNACQNPCAEVNTNGWAIWLGASGGSPVGAQSADTPDAANYPKSFEASNLVAGGGAPTTAPTPLMIGTYGMYSNHYACQPGETIRGHIFIKVAAVPASGVVNYLQLHFRYLKADGSYLLDQNIAVGQVNSPATGTWYEFSGTGVAPANAAFVAVAGLAEVHGSTDAYTIRMTGAMTIGDSLLPPGVKYVDGRADLGRWSGAVGASTSYYGAPLYGLILPGRRCEVDVSFDNGTSWAPICGGWLGETESDPDYGSSQARLNFTDLAYLDRPVPAIASTGPTTVAAALGLVHDAIGWDGTRDFRSTAPLADFSADGTTTARQIIADLIKVDLGFYYVSKGNVATYVDKYEYARRASVGTFESMGSSIPGVSLKSIINGASAQKGSGAVQTYQDSVSRGKYGPLDDPQGAIQSDWFNDDAAALSNATWRVQIAKDPVGAYWQFQPIPSDDANLQAAISAEMLDVATIQPISLPAEDQQCQWIVHDFGGGRAHIVTWRLRELPAMKPIIVGSSTVGGSNVIAT